VPGALGALSTGLNLLTVSRLSDRPPSCILDLFAGAITVAVRGCAGPPVLERQVLG